MGYITENLMPGEKLLYRAHLHWIVYACPILFLAFSLMIASDDPGDLAELMRSIFFFVGLITTVSAYLKRKTSEFGITNKRVIVKIGIIQRDTVELLLAKVEGVQVNQGIFGRFLGYGSITLTGTGSTHSPIKQIADPLEFRRQVQSQIAAIQDTK